MSAGGDTDLAKRFVLPVEEGASRVMSLGDAITRFIRPGSIVHVAYSDARPNAAIFELVRCFAGRDAQLTLVTAGLVNAQLALVETGVVRHLIASFVGENFPVARPNAAFQRALGEGRITVENWSLWTLTARLIAGALGIPFFPVRSLANSSMAEEHADRDYVVIRGVGTESETGAVTPLRPDVVLLQGVAADAHGNVVMAAPYGESYWGALASRTGVIACVERIVDTQTIRNVNHLVRIPAHCVLAVCDVPFGSHPYGAYSPAFPGVQSYLEDEEFIADAYLASRDGSRFKQWIADWITGVASHNEYLDKLGHQRLGELVARARHDAWEQELDVVQRQPEATRQELLVIAAARQLQRRVRERHFDTVLAGVGLSNLAAWLAVAELKRGGVDIELTSEIGMYGYDPRPGDPFIFSKRNVPTCKMLTDVAGVLAAMVAGPRTSCIGVIGAGQVDAQANLNSTYLPDGRFLVGSGGANDIASSAEELLVTVDHTPGRLVARLPYVTCPGHNVRTLVSTLGIFERVDGDFRLMRYLPAAGSDAREAVARITQATEWPFDVADCLCEEAPPSSAELERLRLFDPRRVFLR